MVGIGCLRVARVFGELAARSSRVARAAAAAAFVALGVYQLTPLKFRCLSHCRSPLAHLLHYTSFKGRLRDLRAGIEHGLYCLGCCWALMLVLVAFGVMNLPAMIAVAAIIAVEKVWRYGETLRPRRGRRRPALRPSRPDPAVLGARTGSHMIMEAPMEEHGDMQEPMPPAEDSPMEMEPQPGGRTTLDARPPAERSSGGLLCHAGVTWPRGLPLRFDKRLARMWLPLRQARARRRHRHRRGGARHVRLAEAPDPRSNVLGGHVTGPYRWHTVVGARLSFVDDGLTFGTNRARASPGLLLGARRPRPAEPAPRHACAAATRTTSRRRCSRPPRAPSRWPWPSTRA